MERTETKTHKQPPPPSFDVTCVIGTVLLDGSSETPPHVVAFMLIGEHNAPGAYRFQHENGGEILVTVEHPLP